MLGDALRHLGEHEDANLARLGEPAVRDEFLSVARAWLTSKLTQAGAAVDERPDQTLAP